MMRTTAVGIELVVVTCLALLLPGSANAQGSVSSIVGVVRDAAGLPVAGVEVEAASAALIEKARVATTDSQGQYKIVDLVPGVYVVTFKAAGFMTARHEGIELSAGFSATVSAGLQKGSATETITVTAATSAVDTQNNSQQRVVTAEANDALPTGQRNITNIATVTTGLAGGQADVGGTSGAYNSQGNNATFHGKGNIKRLVDGLRVDNMEAMGNAGYIINSVTIQNVVTETGGGSAESLASGFMINNIPKSGSNAFKLEGSGLYTNNTLESPNLTDELRARGLSTANNVSRLYDWSATAGGPIAQNKLWYFLSVRYWGTSSQRAGVYYDATEGSPLYTPDLARPANRDEYLRSGAGRFTFQLSPKMKLNGFIDIQNNCKCYAGTPAAGASPTSIEADHTLLFNPNNVFQLTWTRVGGKTGKLLMEAGFSATASDWLTTPLSTVGLASITPGAIQITDTTAGFAYNSPGVLQDKQDSERFAERFTTSYVTGSHAIKGGIQVEEGYTNKHNYVFGALPVTYNFLGGAPGAGDVPTVGVPNQVVQYAYPNSPSTRMMPDLGIFIQDQWTIKRLTLNYGLRYDWFRGYDPTQSTEATYFTPAKTFAEVDNVPNWKDISPRVGGAYDLFGNGRTAIKAALGKYMGLQSNQISSANNPMTTSVNSVTRQWTDTNGNYVPDCVLTNPAANGECGAINNANFGQNNPLATQYANDAIHGWGARDYQWDFSTELQHQFTRSVSATVGYYRNWLGNFLVTDNTAVSPSDFSPYCVNAPTDPRLPNGGGYPICGLYDISVAKFSASQNVVTQASHFGQQTTVNNFFGLNMSSRWARGARISGGVDFGRTVTDNCFVVYSPAQTTFNLATPTNPSYCHIVIPWAANLQVKANGSYPLPAGFTVSGTFQNSAGPQDTALYQAPNSAIASSLGRNLAACGALVVCKATAPIPLIVPGTKYEARLTQLDFRLAKTFKVGPKARVQAKFDLYNALNSSAIQTVNVNYGSQWLRPIAILNGRLAEFSATFSY